MTREEMDLMTQKAIAETRKKKRAVVDNKMELEAKMRESRQLENEEIQRLCAHKASMLQEVNRTNIQIENVKQHYLQIRDGIKQRISKIDNELSELNRELAIECDQIREQYINQ